MTVNFPSSRGVAAWHLKVLGKDPFRGSAAGAAASFFRPAAAVCRKPVPAEILLPKAIPARLRRDLCAGLRMWQASQRITDNFLERGELLPGMDMPMTLNFAMALGNYSRFFLFSGAGRLAPEAALALHSAFASEMSAMPLAMAAGRRSPASSPGASARRLAEAFSAAFAKGRV